MPSDEEINRLRKQVSGTEEIETTFRQLRTDGYSRLQALRLILDVLDVSLREAKSILITSETWDEARAEAKRPAATKSRDHDAYGNPPPPAPAD